MDKHKRVWRVLVPILIGAAIIGLYLLKNAGQPAATEQEALAEIVTPLALETLKLETIRAYGLPTIIDFSAEWCGPCQSFKPLLEQMNAEWQGKAAVQIVDVDTCAGELDQIPLQVVPTQIFYTAAGKPFVPSDALASVIQFQMYSLRETGEHVLTVHQGILTEEQLRQIFAEMGVE